MGRPLQSGIPSRSPPPHSQMELFLASIFLGIAPMVMIDLVPDGRVYGSVVGFGFAAVENVFYFWSQPDAGSLSSFFTAGLCLRDAPLSLHRARLSEAERRAPRVRSRPGKAPPRTAGNRPAFEPTGSARCLREDHSGKTPPPASSADKAAPASPAGSRVRNDAGRESVRGQSLP
jgi:hypothetical protein